MEWLTLLEAKRQAQNQYTARCPAHDDQKASLSINTAEKDKTLINCHAGCSVEDICAAVGKETKDLFGGDASTTTPAQPTKPTIPTQPTTDAQPQSKGKPTGEPITSYDYVDIHGKIQLRKVRHPNKEFRWYHLTDGGWNGGRAGAVPALYGSPLGANETAVWWVEGEKDVETMKAHGLVAVSAPDGAKSKLVPEQLEPLRGKHVAIIPDNDEPGRKHAETVAGMLQGIAATIKVLDLKKMWPDLEEHGDVSDLYPLLGEDTTETLQAHVISTPEWDATQPTQPTEPSTNSDPPELEATNATDLMTKEFPPLIQAVDRLICEGLTVLVAASKIGKSWLVLLMAICVGLGEQFLGRQTTKCRVIYFALEDSQRRLQSRLRKMNITRMPNNLQFVTKAQMIDTGFLQQVETWLAQGEGPALVIIDTLQKVRGIAKKGINTYEGDYDVVGGIKALADKYRAMIVCVHHTNKAKNVTDIYDKVSGSMGIMGAADTTILIDRERGKDTATVHFEGRDAWGDDFVIQQGDDCRWELMHNNVLEYNAGVAYEEEPLVQLFRKLITENPGGGRWAYSKLQAMGLELLEYQPFIDGRDCANKLNDGLANELRKRDGIVVETSVQTTGGKGVRVMQVPKIIAFPTKMQIDEDEPT